MKGQEDCSVVTDGQEAESSGKRKGKKRALEPVPANAGAEDAGALDEAEDAEADGGGAVSDDGTEGGRLPSFAALNQADMDDEDEVITDEPASFDGKPALIASLESPTSVQIPKHATYADRAILTCRCPTASMDRRSASSAHQARPARVGLCQAHRYSEPGDPGRAAGAGRCGSRRDREASFRQLPCHNGQPGTCEAR